MNNLKKENEIISKINKILIDKLKWYEVPDQEPVLYFQHSMQYRRLLFNNMISSFITLGMIISFSIDKTLISSTQRSIKRLLKLESGKLGNEESFVLKVIPENYKNFDLASFLTILENHSDDDWEVTLGEYCPKIQDYIVYRLALLNNDMAKIRNAEKYIHTSLKYNPDIGDAMEKLEKDFYSKAEEQK